MRNLRLSTTHTNGCLPVMFNLSEWPLASGWRHVGPVLLLVMLLTGCHTAQRECQGFHDPKADLWSPRSIGDSMTFASPDGATVTYTYSSRTDSEPYTGYATGSQDESSIICYMESARVLTLNNGNAGIRLRFEKNDFLNRPKQRLLLGVGLQEPVGTNLKLGFMLINLDELEDNNHLAYQDGPTDSRVARYYPERQIGQTLYQNVIEVEEVDRASVEQRAPSMASAIIRVAFAEGVGLVEFERVDSTVFSRIPE